MESVPQLITLLTQFRKVLPVTSAVVSTTPKLLGTRSSLSFEYIIQPSTSCFVLLRQPMACALHLARLRAGKSMLARIAMMAMTTRSAIRVKAEPFTGHFSRRELCFCIYFHRIFPVTWFGSSRAGDTLALHDDIQLAGVRQLIGKSLRATIWFSGPVWQNAKSAQAVLPVGSTRRVFSIA